MVAYTGTRGSCLAEQAGYALVDSLGQQGAEERTTGLAELTCVRTKDADFQTAATRAIINFAGGAEQLAGPVHTVSEDKTISSLFSSYTPTMNHTASE